MEWFLLVLMGLFSFRLQRILTTDTWPPSMWFRTRLDERYGPKSAISEFFHCPWCCGSILSFGVVAVADAVIGLHWPILQAGAVAGIVGLLARNLDD